MNVYEMEGFLRGKCLPGDMKVNETNAQYLVRKFSELQSQNTDMAVQLANAESKCRELAVESAGLKNPDNWLSQSDYGYEASEVATQNGATEDESLRAGMIAIINRIGTPATDAFLAEVRAQGLERLAKAWYAIANETSSGISISESSRLKYRQRADDVADFANKIRQEAAQ
ncbi:hypothetical protein NMO11_003234 [Citrobacter freundii]|uniref:Uncharacterized protein n=1 Tax=Citrobacter freundii TaxID=546 RepID=A0AAD2SJI0_CITFR|nr:hypothetical protein [Citrobacter freundii]EJR7282571.1 hypothetical protein [Citrobacter freundii]EKT9389014.1 hypothetical protein [Citrobacter freundii]EKU1807797.1 hypothetical protein [Citrobacter freundii]EKU8470335.1 hypothetical protein [Citrobacter freundii]EKU8529313.1 hypothetical protein [Citrobacter freundii]